jgi:hypothetical protein
MNSLEVIWRFQSGDYGAAVIEHLFGWDLHFVRLQGETWFSVRTTPIARPLDFLDESRVRSAVWRWELGDYSRLVQVSSDLAST